MLIALNTGTVPINVLISTDHYPDRRSDKSSDLLKRTQKCPQERRLEREGSRSRRVIVSNLLFYYW